MYIRIFHRLLSISFSYRMHKNEVLLQVEISSSLEVSRSPRRLQNLEDLREKSTMAFGIALLVALVVCLSPSGTNQSLS